ncbi:MAG: NUDIX domain-containing protein [Caldilineaceae bacterium]
MGNGQVRRRNTFPAEKMRPGEDALTAARRCLDEELHIDESAFLSEPVLVQTQTHRLDSPSYPGLPSCFTIHTVEIHVDGLPTGEFSTLNRAFAKGDPVRVHHWRWQEIEE